MIAYIAFVCVCFGAGVTTGYKWQQLRYLERENELQAQHAEQVKTAQDATAAQIKITEQARTDLQKNIEAAKNENNTLSADLEHGRKWMRILVLRQKSCGASQAGSPGGVETEYAEIAPEVRRNIQRFREAVIEHDARMEFLETTCRQFYKKF